MANSTPGTITRHAEVDNEADLVAIGTGLDALHGRLYLSSDSTTIFIGNNDGSLAIIGDHSIDDHTDVAISSLVTNDILQFNGTNWVNKTLAASGLVPTSRTLTINGTAYDLSVDRSWSVGTVTSFSAGDLSPLFTTSEATTTTTPALTFTLTSSVNQYEVFGRSIAGTGAPSFVALDNVAFTGNYNDLSSLPTIPVVSYTDMQIAFGHTATAGLSSENRLLWNYTNDNIIVSKTGGLAATNTFSTIAGINVYHEASSLAAMNVLVSSNASSVHRGYIVFNRSTGTLAAPAAVAPGWWLGGLVIGGHEGTTFQHGAGMEAFVDGAVSTGSVPARLSFMTGANTATRLERFTIYSNGDIKLVNLAGSGNRMVIANSTGYLSTQAIPTGTVTNFSAGDLSPLFTTSEATTTTTPALTFALSNVSQYQVFGRTAASTGPPSWLTLDSSAFEPQYWIQVSTTYVAPLAVDQIRTRNAGGEGYISIVKGDGTHTGYVEFLNTSASRIGYIG